MIKRIDQQIFVTKTMIDMYSLRKFQIKASELYDKLFGDYDDGFLYYMYSI